jgi:hypothetical protein
MTDRNKGKGRDRAERGIEVGDRSDRVDRSKMEDRRDRKDRKDRDNEGYKLLSVLITSNNLNIQKYNQIEKVSLKILSSSETLSQIGEGDDTNLLEICATKKINIALIALISKGVNCNISITTCNCKEDILVYLIFRNGYTANMIDVFLKNGNYSFKGKDNSKLIYYFNDDLFNKDYLDIFQLLVEYGLDIRSLDDSRGQNITFSLLSVDNRFIRKIKIFLDLLAQYECLDIFDQCDNKGYKSTELIPDCNVLKVLRKYTGFTGPIEDR